MALTAAYGPEVGHEATAEALSYGWRHWDRVVKMENPVGFLFRVGQSRARRYLIWWNRRPCPPIEPGEGNPEPWIEPGLPQALGRLSKRQRVTVVLVAGFGWTQGEVADLFGVCRTTVEQHLSRVGGASEGIKGGDMIDLDRQIHDYYDRITIPVTTDEYTRIATGAPVVQRKSRPWVLAAAFVVVLIGVGTWC